MQTETKYKIGNWAEYNRALIQRGSITIWIEEESLKSGIRQLTPVWPVDLQPIPMMRY